MTKRRATTRMGMLGLLLLVIAICLAVLGLLAGVTAHSERVMAQRHAEAVSSDAVSDAGAQSFLAELDSWLARARSSGVSLSVLPSALERDLPTLIELPWTTSWWPPQDGVPTQSYAQVRMLDADELALVSGPLVGGSPLCGVGASFLEDGFSDEADRRVLDVTVVIYGDYTYGLTNWQITTEWLDDTTDMKLWEG